MSLKQWYSDGLHFKCTGCGKCCTGFPGYVWVSEEEIAGMANFLNLSISEFSAKYLRQVGDRVSLIEQPVSYDCVFFKDKQCTIYEARPLQCRTYPFWKSNLASEEAWEKTALECEGIRDSYPKVPNEIIEKNLNGKP